MPAIVEKANEALNLNSPSGVDLHLTTHGSDWLWAAFCIFAVFALGHTVYFLYKGRQSVGNIAALSLASILSYTYFTLASDLGWTGIEAEFKHVTVDDPQTAGQYIRQIFYARYIGWFLAFPVLLFLVEYVGHGSSFKNFTAKSFATYALEVGGASVFVIGLLIGSLVKSTYKWGYFTFSTSSALFILGVLNFNVFKTYADEINSFSKTAIALFDLLWILYPIAWGLADGGNVIQPDSEQVFYGILDLVTFLIVPLALVYQANSDSAAPITTPVSPAGNHNKELPSEVPRASGETAV